MKGLRRFIIGISLCLLLGLTLPLGTGSVAKAADNNTIHIGYVPQSAGTGIDPSQVTIVEKGTVKTGDEILAGRYAIFLIGSAAIILILLLAREKKEEEENRF